MESPNLSIRIRRHETLPCPAFNPAHGKSTAPTCGLRRHRTQAHTTASILIGRRLGATKNNPYVGSFRHSPPTSLRSMEASSLPSLSSRKDPSSMLLSPMFFMTTKRSESPSTSLAALSSSVPAMKTSPYVGWFRHAPPSILSFSHVHSAKNKKKDDQRNESKVSRAALVQHKVNHNCLQELDRWHQQLTSLLMGIDNGTSCKESKESPPLMLRRIINGRLLGGSGKHDRNLMENIPQDNISGSRSIMNMADVTNPGYSSILLRLTSWLLFPLLYADEDCYDEFGFIGSEGKLKATDSRLLLPSQHDERSIEIDSDDEMDSDDDDSFASNYDYNERYNEKGISPETEREFKEMNVSVSEIAETYYAHQLLEDRDNDSSAQSPLSPSSYHNTNGDSFVTRQRLDYEITQMDIARMTRNASRHLDVDSILTLPTIIYRRKQRSNFSPTSVRNEAKCLTQDGEQSYHHVCRPIPEGKAKHSTADRKREFQILEDGWSFLMVSGVKREERGSQISNGDALDPIDVVDEASELKQCNDDVCVICLEPFKEGDRLRVLPCDHSFHVGCIDRWLSGSHSHNECFTAGCPTCKKRPTSSPHSPSLPRIDTSVNMEKEADVDGEIMSGSLPSWAFANLGSAMAMSSGGFPDS